MADHDQTTSPPPQDEPLDSALREEIEREVDAAFADVTPLEADDEDESAAEQEANGPPSAAEEEGGADIQEPPPAEPAFDDDRDSDREAERILMEEVAQLAAAEEKIRRSGRPPKEVPPGPEEVPPGPEPATVDAVEETERQALLAEQPADTRPQASDEESSRDQPAQAGPAPGTLLLPLRVLVSLLGIIDLPFRGLGPDTRSVLGKLAIGYLVVAALIFAYVLLRPLF